MFKLLIVPIIYFILTVLLYLTIGFIVYKNIGYMYIIAFVEGLLMLLSFIQAKRIYEYNAFKKGMKELFWDD